MAPSSDFIRTVPVLHLFANNSRELFTARTTVNIRTITANVRVRVSVNTQAKITPPINSRANIRVSVNEP